MKRLLLATAAVIALAVAAPIATAQYTTPPPATAPYTTPLPDDPATPQDESLSAQTNTTTQSQSTLTTPGVPETTDPLPSTTAQTTTGVDTTTQAQTDLDSTQAQTGVDATTQAQTDSYAPGATTYGSTTTESYADASTGMGENVATPASLDQHARDAGMDAMPMTAQDVCAPREISLTTSGTRLSRDKEHMLINAADRASVCEFQRVTINSPNGRADQARQLLIDHGVDAGMIEVVDSDTGGLEVDMNFAGVATSSEQYAQMFATQQLASYQPGTTAPGYAPSTAPSYQPSPSAPPVNDPSMSDPSTLDDPSMETPDPNADPMDDMDDGMSPTSGRPAVQPGMLDI
jgi:hypothetical protein